MITPRITRLVRVPDLQGMQAYLARCLEPSDARSVAIIVPSRSAAEALRETIETRSLADSPAVLLPDLVTRDEFVRRAARAAPRCPTASDGLRARRSSSAAPPSTPVSAARPRHFVYAPASSWKSSRSTTNYGGVLERSTPSSAC